MSFSKLLALGLLYLPIGFVLGHFYTNYTHNANMEKIIDSTSLSPWEARYHSLEIKFKEMSEVVENIYSSDDSETKSRADKIDAKKLLASVQVMVNDQYSEMESDVKQNIVDLCLSINEKKGKK